MPAQAGLTIIGSKRILSLPQTTALGCQIDVLLDATRIVTPYLPVSCTPASTSITFSCRFLSMKPASVMHKTAAIYLQVLGLLRLNVGWLRRDWTKRLSAFSCKTQAKLRLPMSAPRTATSPTPEMPALMVFRARRPPFPLRFKIQPDQAAAHFSRQASPKIRLTGVLSQ